MSRLKLLCIVAVVIAGAVGARYLWWGSVGDHHTVDWYLAHEDQLKRVSAKCENDHALDDDPDCRNAAAAKRKAGWEAMRQQLGTVPPDFWDDNGQAPKNAPQPAAPKAGQ